MAEVLVGRGRAPTRDTPPRFLGGHLREVPDPSAASSVTAGSSPEAVGARRARRPGEGSSSGGGVGSIGTGAGTAACSGHSNGGSSAVGSNRQPSRMLVAMGLPSSPSPDQTQQSLPPLAPGAQSGGTLHRSTSGGSTSRAGGGAGATGWARGNGTTSGIGGGATAPLRNRLVPGSTPPTAAVDRLRPLAAAMPRPRVAAAAANNGSSSGSGVAGVSKVGAANRPGERLARGSAAPTAGGGSTLAAARQQPRRGGPVAGPGSAAARAAEARAATAESLMAAAASAGEADSAGGDDATAVPADGADLYRQHGEEPHSGLLLRRPSRHQHQQQIQQQQQQQLLQHNLHHSTASSLSSTGSPSSSQVALRPSSSSSLSLPTPSPPSSAAPPPLPTERTPRPASPSPSPSPTTTTTTTASPSPSPTTTTTASPSPSPTTTTTAASSSPSVFNSFVGGRPLSARLNDNALYHRQQPQQPPQLPQPQQPPRDALPAGIGALSMFGPIAASPLHPSVHPSTARPPTAGNSRPAAALAPEASGPFLRAFVPPTYDIMAPSESGQAGSPAHSRPTSARGSVAEGADVSNRRAPVPSFGRSLPPAQESALPSSSTAPSATPRAAAAVARAPSSASAAASAAARAAARVAAAAPSPSVRAVPVHAAASRPVRAAAATPSSASTRTSSTAVRPAPRAAAGRVDWPGAADGNDRDGGGRRTSTETAGGGGGGRSTGSAVPGASALAAFNAHLDLLTARDPSPQSHVSAGSAGSGGGSGSAHSRRLSHAHGGVVQGGVGAGGAGLRTAGRRRDTASGADAAAAVPYALPSAAGSRSGAGGASRAAAATAATRMMYDTHLYGSDGSVDGDDDDGVGLGSRHGAALRPPPQRLFRVQVNHEAADATTFGPTRPARPPLPLAPPLHQQQHQQQQYLQRRRTNNDDGVVGGVMALGGGAAGAGFQERFLADMRRRDTERAALMQLLMAGGEEELLRQAEEEQLALALMLSLQEARGGPGAGDALHREMALRVNHGSLVGVVVAEPALSYEELLNLEDVKVTTPAEVLDALPYSTYDSATCAPNSACAICQCDYERGDRLLRLPCAHMLHEGCARQWLGEYSKKCPVCKQAVC